MVYAYIREVESKEFNKEKLSGIESMAKQLNLKIDKVYTETYKKKSKEQPVLIELKNVAKAGDTIITNNYTDLSDLFYFIIDAYINNSIRVVFANEIILKGDAEVIVVDTLTPEGKEFIKEANDIQSKINKDGKYDIYKPYHVTADKIVDAILNLTIQESQQLDISFSQFVKDAEVNDGLTMQKFEGNIIKAQPLFEKIKLLKEHLETARQQRDYNMWAVLEDR